MRESCCNAAAEETCRVSRTSARDTARRRSCLGCSRLVLCCTCDTRESATKLLLVMSSPVTPSSGPLTIWASLIFNKHSPNLPCVCSITKMKRTRTLQTHRELPHLRTSMLSFIPCTDIFCIPSGVVFFFSRLFTSIHFHLVNVVWLLVENVESVCVYVSAYKEMTKG